MADVKVGTDTRRSTTPTSFFDSQEMYGFNGKSSDLTYMRLYNEKTIYLDRENHFSVYMGIKPLINKDFLHELRLCDHRTGHVMQLTKFQFVRMISDLCRLIWPKDKITEREESDEQYGFYYWELEVPHVRISSVEIDSNITKYFKVGLPANLNNYIILDLHTVNSMIDLERFIVSLYLSLDSANYQKNTSSLLRRLLSF